MKKSGDVFMGSCIGVHSCRGLGGGGEVCWKKVEHERPLDEGTEWVVGCSTESVESSPSTESMDSWTVVPWTESVDFYLSIELQRMSLYPSLGLHTVPM